MFSRRKKSSGESYQVWNAFQKKLSRDKKPVAMFSLVVKNGSGKVYVILIVWKYGRRWWRGQTARGEDWWRSVKQQWTPRPSHPPLPTVWGKRTNEKANRQTVWKRKSIWSNSSDIIYAYFYSSDFRLPPSLHVFNVLYYMGEASLSLSTKCTKPKVEG